MRASASAMRKLWFQYFPVAETAVLGAGMRRLRLGGTGGRIRDPGVVHPVTARKFATAPETLTTSRCRAER